MDPGLNFPISPTRIRQKMHRILNHGYKRIVYKRKKSTAIRAITFSVSIGKWWYIPYLSFSVAPSCRPAEGSFSPWVWAGGRQGCCSRCYWCWPPGGSLPPHPGGSGPLVAAVSPGGSGRPSRLDAHQHWADFWTTDRLGIKYRYHRSVEVYFVNFNNNSANQCFGCAYIIMRIRIQLRVMLHLVGYQSRQICHICYGKSR